MHWHSGNGDNFEELPEDIDDREKYVKLPTSATSISASGS